jgi:hypothetical protein
MKAFQERRGESNKTWNFATLDFWRQKFEAFRFAESSPMPERRFRSKKIAQNYLHILAEGSKTADSILANFSGRELLAPCCKACQMV